MDGYNVCEKNPIDQINYKIKKYRAKSLLDEHHEKRLLYYISQNHLVNTILNTQTGGAGAGTGPKTRKAPEQSATLYKVGTKKTGIDGSVWSIVETSNGTKRWKLHKKVI